MHQDPPAGYVKALQAMADAAMRWLSEHEHEQPHFRVTSADCGIAMNLNHAIPYLAANDEARAMLAYMEAESQQAGTAMMAITIVRVLDLSRDETLIEHLRNEGVPVRMMMQGGDS